MSLGGVVGCTEQRQDSESPGDEQFAGTPDTSEKVTTSDWSGGTRTANDVSALDGDDAADENALAQECVFIQFCDEPPAGGTWKVVGKVRAGACRNQCVIGQDGLLFSEFFGDARAVCGKTSLDGGKWRLECF